MRPAVNALGPRAPPTARGLGSRWGRPSRAHPAVAQSFSRAASRGRGSPSPAGPPTIERVLRYPGGRERRIRYPAPPSDEDQEEDGRGCATASATAVSACEQEFRAGQIYEHGYCTPDDDGCMLNDLDWTADKMRPWGEPVSASPRGRNGSSRPELCLNKDGVHETADRPNFEGKGREAFGFFDDMPWDSPALDGPSKGHDFPGSPADLIRQVTSTSYKVAQEKRWAEVAATYEILEACPWLIPRQVFCLASASGQEAGGPNTYTLRTRISVVGAGDELSKIFQKSRPGIGRKFNVDKMVDGLVTFEDADDAECFLHALEVDGNKQLQLAEVESHQLFRIVQDVGAAVVLLRSGCDVPLPSELKASLQGKNPVEGM